MDMAIHDYCMLGGENKKQGEIYILTKNDMQVNPGYLWTKNILIWYFISATMLILLYHYHCAMLFYLYLFQKIQNELG